MNDFQGVDMNKPTCITPDCTNRAQPNLRSRCRTHFEALKVNGVLPPKPRPSLQETFSARVSRTDTCWIWEGALTGDGYGAITYRAKKYKAHRLAWELHKHDPVPAIVDHMCRETLCVNPNHLQAATRQTNGENLARDSAANRTTGVRGVHYKAETNRFHAYASSGGKRHHAGCFPTEAEAEAAAIAKRLEIQTNNLVDRARDLCSASTLRSHPSSMELTPRPQNGSTQKT